MTLEHLPIFVYGTLQRGEERAHHWPRKPLSIEPAEVRGRLYDLGPYPALLAGEDRVAGELWLIAAEDMEETCRALDIVEGCDLGDDELYRREIVDCRTASGRTLRAYTYRYSRERDVQETMRLRAGGDGLCRWPKRFS